MPMSLMVGELILESSFEIRRWDKAKGRVII